MGYESRIVLLTGFGRYLLSRYETNPIFKDSLIQLVNLLNKYIEPTQNNIPEDTLSLFGDLYLSHIEKEKIEPYLLSSIDTTILDIQKEPQSRKLFMLIKLSNLTSCILCRQTVYDALSTIFTRNYEPFASINEFQWLLQCKKEIEGGSYTIFNSELTSKITEVVAFYNLCNLEEMFSDVKKFSLQGGYSGLALALLSVINSDDISWTKLL